ncbi:polymorphic toxin type 15 domain-containing protein [Streptococcus australis]|uniref:Putative transposase n=2 Tax=Streptococcus TaxID=1301 RepID=A0A4V0BQL2_9STRE|nr:polymorphic toxin type 15 domain-containing protein [Streptococcus australis]VTS70865.1 putative transposase [Streptococcus australis]
MGFYVDIAELQKAQEVYMKMVATAQSQLDTAKNGMNAIITSNSMHGEVGKAITNEINNVHNPVIVGLKNSLEFLGSEFSKTITDFQNLVGETSATAVLAEETLDDAVKKLNEADEKHKVMDTNFKSIYDGTSSLYHLSAPLSSTFYTNTQTARKYVQDTKNKVNAFDKMMTTSSTEQLFNALSSQMAAAGRVKSLSYSDPILTDFVAHEELGKAIYELDQQYAKAKAEAIEAAKRKAEQEAAEREASYRRHHPIQAWLKDRSNEIGSWWGDVVEGTRNLPLPQGMKDTLLFAEGFIGAAGSMVSETAIGAVDLTQIIGIASIDGVNRLTDGQTPEWMKRDLQGTTDNLSSLAELGVGTYTALTDPGAAQRGQDPNASYADKAAYRAQETGKALWDKVTHMDAYDAGGLTFEIASLFVGPAAVGKMAKGTKLGAKAAEMIQLAKNSTKARILANVEKWGSKVDNILAKSNNVIGKFGEKLLDTRIPVGIRKEAVAFSGGMGIMPTFSVESRTLRDVMHFSSKHADDVVRGVGGSGEVANRGEDLLQSTKEIQRIEEINVVFKRNPKHDEVEFIRQFKGQEEGLNKLTVKEYFENRKEYIKNGRSSEAKAAQKAARENALADKYNEMLLQGNSRSEAKRIAEDWIKTQAALHDPDMIAGGYATKITGMGDTRINSSLGSQWRSRISEMDQRIRKATEHLLKDDLDKTRLNIKLEYIQR